MSDAAPSCAARRPRRPVTIWILQVFLALLLMGSATGAAIILWKFVSNGIRPESAIAGSSFIRFLLIDVAWFTAVLGTVYAAFVGLQRRKSYGRWLALVILAGLLTMGIYEHPNPFALEQDDCGNGPLCFHYDNQGELEGGRDARVAMEIGFLILVCQLLFAKSVKNYFQPAAPASPVSAAKPVDGQ